MRVSFARRLKIKNLKEQYAFLSYAFSFPYPARILTSLAARR